MVIFGKRDSAVSWGNPSTGLSARTSVPYSLAVSPPPPLLTSTTFRWYATFISERPWIVFLVASLVVLICGPVGFWYAGLPEFTDPNVGFEPRGTDIKGRDIANIFLLEGLQKGEYVMYPNTTAPNVPFYRDQNSSSVLLNNNSSPRTDELVFGGSAENCHEEVISGVTVVPLPPALKKQQNEENENTPTSLARFAIQAKDKSESLWDVQKIQAICDIEERFIMVHFPHLSCAAHSLPYYIGLLQNRNNCKSIDETDLDEVYHLLIACSSYYLADKINPLATCDNYTSNCTSRIPARCTKYDAVYYIIHYFTDISFQPWDNRFALSFLRYSLIIFRRSWNISANQLFDYYLSELLEKQLTNSEVEVVAMDLYLIRDRLSSFFIVNDLPFYGLAFVLVLIVLFLYLRSFVLMLVVICNIGLTLIVGYFIYHVIARQVIFSFTNILIGLLLIAIGADDVFIFVDVWYVVMSELEFPEEEIDIVTLASLTLSHAFMSILVTSLTTAAALFANVASNVIALKCFGIFGGICIFVNFFFMVTLIPSVLIMMEIFARRYPKFANCYNIKRLEKFHESVSRANKYVWGKIIPTIVINGAYVLIIIFLIAGLFSLVVVFYHPQFQLPNSETFQIFRKENPIEIYRSTVKDKLRFELSLKNRENISLNFVFGLNGKDNGNYFDPNDRGEIRFTSDFEIFSPESQLWLQRFCANLVRHDKVRNPFSYACFMDVVSSIVETRCSSYPMIPTKCCGSTFPLPATYAKTCFSSYNFIDSTFSYANDANLSLIGSPIFLQDSNKIKALVFTVETNQHFTAKFNVMNDFYTSFKNWMEYQLNNVPDGLQSGFFTGAYGEEFFFYDLQRNMLSGVVSGICLSMAVGFIIMLLTSGNFFITLLAIFTITLVISSVVAILVFLGWELNILETLIITLSVGLSIDFTIHLGVAFKISLERTRSKKVKDAISTIGFAVTMAAITTFLSGTALTGGRVLSYYRFGVFLMLDMVVSWLFSFFFFLPLCRFLGPKGRMGEISSICLFFEKAKVVPTDEEDEGGTSKSEVVSMRSYVTAQIKAQNKSSYVAEKNNSTVEAQRKLKVPNEAAADQIVNDLNVQTEDSKTGLQIKGERISTTHNTDLEYNTNNSASSEKNILPEIVKASNETKSERLGLVNQKEGERIRGLWLSKIRKTKKN